MKKGAVAMNYYRPRLIVPVLVILLVLSALVLVSCGKSSYTLTLDTGWNGTTASKSPDQARYEEGTVVTLTATPPDGFAFLSFYENSTLPWSERFHSNDNPCTVVMQRNMVINVECTQGLTLDVLIDGEGEVSKDPDQPLYPDTSSVELTAIPADGWVFERWEDLQFLNVPSIDTSINPIYIFMIDDWGDRVVTAHFVEVPKYALIVNTVGRGTVSKSPDQDGYRPSDVIELTATPKNGWVFDYWDTGGYYSGPLRGNPITLVMWWNERDWVITAHFVEAATQDPGTTITPGTIIPVTTTAQGYTLNVSVVNQSPPGNGGTVSKSPNQASYAPGTVVTLTATPATNFRFSHWEGAASGTNPTITVTMNGNKSVTAVFYFPIE